MTDRTMEPGWESVNFGNAYRNWMMERMHASKYGILFDVLYDTEFTWASDIPRDSDRASDGRYLRSKFSEESGMALPEEGVGYPCSFLEFLVALAYAIDDNIMYDAENPDQPADWFWMMMSNLGLTDYDDERMLVEGNSAFEEVVGIVDDVLHRKYGYNGYPGLFPLSKPVMDQRNVEIWYQANAYFIEKYFE